jgi:hypothetical protein
MNKLRTITIFALLLIFSLPAYSIDKSGLNEKKMKKVTSEILDIFMDGNSDNLRKYISREWLDEKNVDIREYKINNYSPKFYDIHYAGGDICVATIGGNEWLHLVIFKFTNERGIYSVVPRGFAEASNDYIDPWWYVSPYISESKEKD